MMVTTGVPHADKEGRQLTLGERIKLVRTEKLQLDQAALGRLVGVSSMAISKWERDANDVADHFLHALSEISGVEYEWFLTGRGVSEHQQSVVRLLEMVGTNEEEFLETIEILIKRHFERVQKRNGG